MRTRTKISVAVAAILLLATTSAFAATTLRPLAIKGHEVLLSHYLKTKINPLNKIIAEYQDALPLITTPAGVRYFRSRHVTVPQARAFILRHLAIARRRLADLKKDLRLGVVPKFKRLRMHKLKLGQIGRIGRISKLVRGGQVNMIGRDVRVWSVREIFPSGSALVKYYADVPSGYLPYQRPPVWCMIKGFSFAGVTTPRQVLISGPCIVAGTKTYVTAAGTYNTVFVIRPFKIVNDLNKKGHE